MHSSWIKGFESDRDGRKKKVLSYRPALNELKEILERDFKKKEAVRNYEEPNWELRQIAVNEYNQVLNDVMKLITIKED